VLTAIFVIPGLFTKLGLYANICSQDKRNGF